MGESHINMEVFKRQWEDVNWNEDEKYFWLFYLLCCTKEFFQTNTGPSMSIQEETVHFILCDLKSSIVLQDSPIKADTSSLLVSLLTFSGRQINFNFELDVKLSSPLVDLSQNLLQFDPIIFYTGFAEIQHHSTAVCNSLQRACHSHEWEIAMVPLLILGGPHNYM